MTEEELLKELKFRFPYLYDLEIRIRRIRASTGFGQLATSYTIRFGEVALGDVGEFTITKYQKN